MIFNKPITQAPDITSLRQYVSDADLTTLLMCTAQLSGDFSILKPQWSPEIVNGTGHIDLSEDEKQEIIDLCMSTLLSIFESGISFCERPTFDELRKMAHWFIGIEAEPYLPLILEELVSEHQDIRKPTWHKSFVAPNKEYSVAIIGAGESGLVAAHRFKQAGIDFRIFEKTSEMGGTWRDNRYPGCRVDINSFAYSFSFARHLWDDYFGEAKDVLTYLKKVAEYFKLEEHILFRHEIKEAIWNEKTSKWLLKVATLTDVIEIEANTVIFAVGQLSRPLIPSIPEAETYKGLSFHSSRWEDKINFNGKRIGVIGAGASAIQFIPHLAKRAEKLVIYSRTPNWLLPTSDLHTKVPSGIKWLMSNLPGYSLWYRASLVIPQVIGSFEAVKVDNAYPPTEAAVSASNAEFRSKIEQWVRPHIENRPDLLEFCLPNSPVGGKRIIRDNGTWLTTLKRQNVKVERRQIECFYENGITAGGDKEDLDIVVYGTGFQASGFLEPIRILGRNGRNLHEWWDNDARAYLGMTIPEFPNLFCMYGPNTNLVVHSNIILFSELSATYIVDSVRLMLQAGHNSMSVRQDVFNSYNLAVDHANLNLAWGFSAVNSWYKNSKGRVSQNYHDTAAEYWRRTHQASPLDFDFT